MDQAQDKEIRKKQKRQPVVNSIATGVEIAGILIITTLWVSNRSQTATGQAVNQVSEFYLEELAGRRVQVVSEELKNNFAYIENVLGILDESNLKSQETLRSFLGKAERLYGLDKFALVDENGIVYTEHSTVSGLSRYNFLSQELTEPVITTANLYGAKKQVILAVPVENIVFQDSRINV